MESKIKMGITTKVQPIQFTNKGKVTVGHIKTEFQTLLFKQRLVISDIEAGNFNLKICNLIRISAYGIRMTRNQEFIISRDLNGNVCVFKMDAPERVFSLRRFHHVSPQN